MLEWAMPKLLFDSIFFYTSFAFFGRYNSLSLPSGHIFRRAYSRYFSMTNKWNSTSYIHFIIWLRMYVLCEINVCTVWCAFAWWCSLHSISDWKMLVGKCFLVTIKLFLYRYSISIHVFSVAVNYIDRYSHISLLFSFLLLTEHKANTIYVHRIHILLFLWGIRREGFSMVHKWYCTLLKGTTSADSKKGIKLSYVKLCAPCDRSLFNSLSYNLFMWRIHCKIYSY